MEPVAWIVAQTNTHHLSIPVRNVDLGSDQQRPLVGFGLVIQHRQGPQHHTKLVEVRLDADIHGNALVVFDERSRLRRLPADRAASSVDVYDLGIPEAVDDNIRKRKISLDKSGIVNI